MSIINQTLRELDARRIESASPRAPLPPVQTALRRRPGVWIAAAGLLPVVGALAWLMSSPAVTAPQRQAVPLQRTAAPQAAMSAPDAPPAARSPAVAGRAPVTARPETLAAASPAKPADPDARDRAHAEQGRAEALPAFSLATKLTDAPESPPPIRKEIRQPSAEEEAEERYRKAVGLMRKGRENQARPLLDEALRLFPGHIAARQTLVALLNEAGKNLEAEAVLREGRAATLDSAWITLSLARLQAARGDADTAAETLLGGIASRGVNAEYHATLAGLLMQLKRHPEAARQYQQALRQQPEQGAWWLGLGLSLAAQGQVGEARAAYRRAFEAGNLPENLLGFVRAKLAEQPD